MTTRVFDPPNRVWEIQNNSIKKIAECDIKSITSDKKLMEFFKLYASDGPLVILQNFGLDAEFLVLAKEFQHACLLSLCSPAPSDAAKPLTFEEMILYSVNKK